MRAQKNHQKFVSPNVAQHQLPSLSWTDDYKFTIYKTIENRFAKNANYE